MPTATIMPLEYQGLAQERASMRFLEYMQPEDFGYWQTLVPGKESGISH